MKVISILPSQPTTFDTQELAKYLYQNRDIFIYWPAEEVITDSIESLLDEYFSD